LPRHQERRPEQLLLKNSDRHVAGEREIETTDEGKGDKISFGSFYLLWAGVAAQVSYLVLGARGYHMGAVAKQRVRRLEQTVKS